MGKRFNLFVTYTCISLSRGSLAVTAGAHVRIWELEQPTRNSASDRSKSAANFRGYFFVSSFLSCASSRAFRSCTQPTIVTYVLWKINVAAIKITRFCIRARVRRNRGVPYPAPLKILQRKVMHYCNIAPTYYAFYNITLRR